MAVRAFYTSRLMYRTLLMLALVAGALVPLESGLADATTIVRTYEAATADARAAPLSVDGPFLHAAEPSGVTTDGRVDVGRLVVPVPADAATLDLDVADAVTAFTPVRYQWFRADGPSTGPAASACTARGTTVTMPVPEGAAWLVVRVYAAGGVTDVGTCAAGASAGATTGRAAFTFST